MPTITGLAINQNINTAFSKYTRITVYDGLLHTAVS